MQMQENQQAYRGFVTNIFYRRLYIFVYVFICTLFMISALLFIATKEKVFLILSIMVFFIVLFDFFYRIPMFSKYYIDKKKITIKFGAIYKKELTLLNSKTKNVELIIRNARKALIYKEKYIIIAPPYIDIDMILHYTDSDLLQVLKEKGVIAIPERYIDSSPVPSKSQRTQENL